MHRTIKLGLVVVLFAMSTAGRAQAAPVVLTAGDFSASDTMIDFETIAQSEEITTQFSALGPSFSGGLFGDTIAGPFYLGSSVTASNFPVLGGPFFNPINVAFSSSIQRVGFDAVTNDPDDITIRTFLSGVQTGSFTFNTSLTPSFLGVGDPAGIDRIEFEAAVNSNGAIGIDNFRFDSSVVPEPATLGLAAVAGLMGLGISWRRRRRAAA